MRATETAVVVATSEVEPAVRKWRTELGPGRRLGRPGARHRALPVCAAAAVDTGDGRKAALRVASVPAFRATFAETGWFDDDVLWLALEPAELFRTLTAAVWRAFRSIPLMGVPTRMLCRT